MPEPDAPGRAILDQINALPRSTRPILICDIDEVVLHLVRHLRTYLDANDLVLLEERYQLTNNIARRGDKTPLSPDAVKRLLQGFFDRQSHDQDLVDGAYDALHTLAEQRDVIFLTNLPGAHNKPLRERLLASYGFSFPLLVNSGPKGGAVAALSANRDGHAVFIDDSPTNHTSVNASLPTAVQVQFIADDSFRANMAQEAHVNLLTGDWAETASFISELS